MIGSGIFVEQRGLKSMGVGSTYFKHEIQNPSLSPNVERNDNHLFRMREKPSNFLLLD